MELKEKCLVKNLEGLAKSRYNLKKVVSVAEIVQIVYNI